MPPRRGADYPPRVIRARRLAIAAIAALMLALACGAALAAKAPPVSVTQRVFADYALDHVIDGGWTISELQSAITAAKGQGAGYRDFQDAVQDVYDRKLGGFHTGGGGTQSTPASPRSNILPEPAGPGDHSQPPWPFIALTVLAGMLIVSGAGSSIYRRVHR